MRTPTASKIALAIAGATGISALSPMPLAPNGPFRCGISMAIGSMTSGHVAQRRQDVIDQIGIDQLAVIVSDLFKHRLADAGDRRAGELLATAERVEGLADVHGGSILDQLELAGVDVDFDFRRSGGKKPKRRSAFFAVFVLGRGLHLPFADQRAALHAETLEHHFGVIELRFRADEFCRRQS